MSFISQFGSLDTVLLKIKDIGPLQLKSKSLFTFGNNSYGQLGDGYSTDPSSQPLQVGSNGEWDFVTAGLVNVSAIKTDGTLWAWGGNNYGKLGDGTEDSRSSPVQIGSLTDWKSVSCGYGHTAAIKTDGTLWTCGYNGYGQLGIGVLVNKSSPTQVGSATDWKSVACGHSHTVAVKTNGTLWSCGYSTYGQLGLGQSYGFNKSIPIQVGSLTNWKSVSCGEYHSLAIKTDGTLWAWGYNAFGQLGLGNDVPRSSPVQVGSLTNWASVSCGLFYTTAVKTDGTLWAWGKNDNYQLGLEEGGGYGDGKSSPVQVGSLTNWKSVAAGYMHTLAIKTDGTLWGWGNNQSGELGNGTTVDKWVPTKVSSSTNWKMVSSGDSFSVGATL